MALITESCLYLTRTQHEFRVVPLHFFHCLWLLPSFCICLNCWSFLNYFNPASRIKMVLAVMESKHCSGMLWGKPLLKHPALHDPGQTSASEKKWFMTPLKIAFKMLSSGEVYGKPAEAEHAAGQQCLWACARVGAGSRACSRSADLCLAGKEQCWTLEMAVASWKRHQARGCKMSVFLFSISEPHWIGKKVQKRNSEFPPNHKNEGKISSHWKKSKHTQAKKFILLNCFCK